MKGGKNLKIRKHIYFSGSVQGVGFRYQASYIAQSLGLTGWVKNLWDGRVEMEVQGNENEINSLFSKLQEGRFISIKCMEIKEISMEEEKSFCIRGY